MKSPTRARSGYVGTYSVVALLEVVATKETTRIESFLMVARSGVVGRVR